MLQMRGTRGVVEGAAQPLVQGGFVREYVGRRQRQRVHGNTLRIHALQAGSEIGERRIVQCVMTCAGFAERIIAEGIARHRRKLKPFAMRGNGVSGYGIFATENIADGTVVFRGEGRAHRIVTARHAASWGDEERLQFRRYAYPLSSEVFALWDAEPAEWAPQNHSCEANTHFVGLDVEASCAIATGEELTLDYATFMSDDSEPFACTCGSALCRRVVLGTEANSVTAREQVRSV